MSISAINEKGQSVDWWFVYKLPKLTTSKVNKGTAFGNTKGTEYLYFDNNTSLSLSSNPDILKSGALFETIEQLRSDQMNVNSKLGWIFYNDEHMKILDPNPKPGKKPGKIGILPDNGDFGHSKGVLAFDFATDTAFWILHSWPAFPSFLPATSNILPPALNFGQTFLCITLKDVATVDLIAKVFHNQSQPQIIEMSIPDDLDAAKFPNISQLVKDAPNSLGKSKVPLGAKDPFEPTPTFNSKGGKVFNLFAKSKDWLLNADQTVDQPKDLYKDLIGPSLKVNLDVETWQDGEGDDDSDHVHSVEDIAFIDLKALDIEAGWHFTLHDHAKWAVSKDEDLANETDWVIVADINRIDSQFERGGCGIAFQDKNLARSLHSIINMIPKPAFAEQVKNAEAQAKLNEKERDKKKEKKHLIKSKTANSNVLQTNINKKDIPDVKPLEYKTPNDNPKLNDLHQIMIQVLESYTRTQKPCDEDSTTYIGKCYRMFLKMYNRQPKDH